MIADCRLWIARCPPWDVVWSGHGSRVVREFCFVKCDAGGDSRLRGNDVGVCGNDGGEIDDWGLGIGDCKVSSLGLWFGWSGHGSMVVRGFCCVKCDAGEIPAYAGMTWAGVGIDDCGLMIGDWGLQGVLLGLWFGWSGHGSMVVRGFC